MTPKEKAEELVEKFIYYTDSGSLTSDLTDEEWHKRNCKKCALIAVDEIIEATAYGSDNELRFIAGQFWQEVKQEMEKL